MILLVNKSAACCEFDGASSLIRGNTRVGTLIVATIYLQLIQNTIDTCFEVLLSFNVVTSIVYSPLPAMWKS